MVPLLVFIVQFGQFVCRPSKCLCFTITPHLFSSFKSTKLWPIFRRPSKCLRFTIPPGPFWGHLETILGQFGPRSESQKSLENGPNNVHVWSFFGPAFGSLWRLFRNSITKQQNRKPKNGTLSGTCLFRISKVQDLLSESAEKGKLVEIIISRRKGGAVVGVVCGMPGLHCSICLLSGIEPMHDRPAQ